MSKCYIIAENEKQLISNLEFLTNEYRKIQKRKNGINLKELFHVSKTNMQCHYDEELCKIYFDEIEVFYINNFFDRRYLQIKKASISNQHERRMSIKLPIRLSIIASIIYSGIFNYLGKEFQDGMILPFAELCKKLLEYKIPPERLKEYIVASIHVFELLAIIIIFLMVVIWIVNRGIDAIVRIEGGKNYNKKIGEKYEIDYIERLLEKNNYLLLKKELSIYEEAYFSIIEHLSYNYLIENHVEFDNVEKIEKEIMVKLLNTAAIYKLKESFEGICEDSVLVKSLIQRVYLKINGNSRRIRMHEGKIYLI